MTRFRFAWLAVVLAVAPAGAWAQDKELSPEARQALKFVTGLQERGYHDLVRDYLKKLRDDPNTPADLKISLDYQEGRALLEEASAANELDKPALLDAARTKLDQFAKNNANHALAPEALTQLARISLERGVTAVVQSHELKGQEEAAKLTAARALFEDARGAYDKALPTLKAAFDAYPKFIPDGNPRKDAKERAHTALMNARLQRAVVDYEDAQSYAMGSKERNERLDTAIKLFEAVYNDYRTQLAGLSARMLEGKCYEEKGELGPAMGIYNELFTQTIQDSTFNEMRRRIGFFRIIVTNKRKEYALAIDEAAQWLGANQRYQNTSESLGVQLELAKALLALAPEMKDSEREEAMRKATARLDEIIRYFSPYKAEALELRRKFKPKSELRDSQIAAMKDDEALAQADSALSTQEWARAIKLFRHAIKKIDPARDPAKANRARYFLAYCYYMDQNYYAAAVICDHLVRHYPRDEFASRAMDIGIAALTMAYRNYTQVDAASDLDRLIDLSKYAVETWPDKDQGDSARFVLGDVYTGRHEFENAAKILESVRAESPKRLDALVQAGEARWNLSEQLRQDGKNAEADASAKAALDLTSKALEGRKSAGTAATDPGMIQNTTNLAEILRGMGKPKDAIALLEPVQKTLQASTIPADVAPLYEKLLNVLLKAHLGDSQTPKAIADLKLLEQAGASRAKLTQLYYDLTKLLKTDMEAQKARRDMVSYNNTKDSFKKFLLALAGSPAGQSYESLLFTGNAMLEMDMGADALTVFDKMLKEYANNPKAAVVLPVLHLKRAAALRKTRKFDDALNEVNELLKANPKDLNAWIEKGFIYEDWAKTKPDKWSDSYGWWKQLSVQLDRARPRKVEYYDSIYHMALALDGMGKKPDAAKTLRGVMTLSPSVGSPEMKDKYQKLLQRFGG